jgi:hypothetical protein
MLSIVQDYHYREDGMKRKGLTWDEHKELGGELKQTDKRLLDLSVRLSKAYGKTSIVARHADVAWNALRKLRHTLDRSDILRRDCPDKSDHELNGLYIGPRVGK